MLRELGAEFIGTFALVSAVCGAALFSAPSAGLIAVAGVFYIILSGAPAAKWNDFIAISNLYGGQHNFSLAAVALTETVMTALFLIVIANVITADRPVGFAPLAI